MKKWTELNTSLSTKCASACFMIFHSLLYQSISLYILFNNSSLLHILLSINLQYINMAIFGWKKAEKLTTRHSSHLFSFVPHLFWSSHVSSVSSLAIINLCRLMQTAAISLSLYTNLLRLLLRTNKSRIKINQHN